MNFYDDLEIEDDADEETVVRAYRHLAKRWHPDKAHPKDKELCAQRFKAIGEAYSILKDPGTRKLYDDYLAILDEGLAEYGLCELTWEQFLSVNGDVRVLQPRRETRRKHTQIHHFYSDIQREDLVRLGQASLVLAAAAAFYVFFIRKPREYLEKVPDAVWKSYIDTTLPISFLVASKLGARPLLRS